MRDLTKIEEDLLLGVDAENSRNRLERAWKNQTKPIIPGPRGKMILFLMDIFILSVLFFKSASLEVALLTSIAMQCLTIFYILLPIVDVAYLWTEDELMNSSSCIVPRAMYDLQNKSKFEHIWPWIFIILVGIAMLLNGLYWDGICILAIFALHDSGYAKRTETAKKCMKSIG